MVKGVEEINLLLEDVGLNLQSMMASPHVRPFAEEVRNWEQRLSLIGEAIEVRGGVLRGCPVHEVSRYTLAPWHGPVCMSETLAQQPRYCGTAVLVSTTCLLGTPAGVDAGAAKVHLP